MSWIPEVRKTSLHESCRTLGKLVAKIQILQLLLLELVFLLRGRGKERVILLLIAQPESRVVIIDPQWKHAHYESTLKDRTDLIVDQEGSVEVAWGSDLLLAAGIHLWVSIIK